MKKTTGFTGREIVIAILIVLVSISIVGVVAAADPQPTDTHGHPIPSSQGTGTGTSGADSSVSDMMETCEQMMGNTSRMSGSVIGSAGAQMMQSVEVSAMGQAMHDDMQGLITKMMAGNLSSTDQARMVEIMNRYPGASNMMLTRMMGGYGCATGGYLGMMGGNGPGWSGYQGMTGTGGISSGSGMMGTGFMMLGVLLAVLFYVVWLAAGILLIIWLGRQVRKDKA